MFKKVEIWILYLTILLSILFAIGFGVLVRQELEGITKKEVGIYLFYQNLQPI